MDRYRARFLGGGGGVAKGVGRGEGGGEGRYGERLVEDSEEVYIYEYIQLEKIISKKVREEGKIYMLFCSLPVMIDRWHSSRQKCGECFNI